MSYSVVFAPEASDQLEALFLYIAERSSLVIAERYTDAVVGTCEGLEKPHQAPGARRVRGLVRSTAPRQGQLRVATRHRRRHSTAHLDPRSIQRLGARIAVAAA